MTTQAGQEFGTVDFMRTGDALERLHITHADPLSRITSELLNEIRESGSPWASLNGDVLTFQADNRTVVYIVGAYDPATNTYEIRWPD